MNSVAETVDSRFTHLETAHAGQVDDLLKIRTPEKMSFEYELAGPVRRLSAWMIDLVVVQIGYFSIVAILFFGATLVLSLFGSLLGPEFSEVFAGMGMAAILVGALMVNWFYGAWMEARYNGQTVGKDWTGLRVLSNDGGAISSGQAIVRNLIRYVDLMPFVPIAFFKADAESWLSALDGWNVPTMMTGFIVMLAMPGFRRLGDLVAGTIVVSERTEIVPDLVSFQDDRVGGLAELLPGSFVPSRTLSLALANYVDRRRRLGPERCAEIAGHIAPLLIQRLELLPDTNHDLLLCSLYYRIFSAPEGIRSGAARRSGK